MGCFNSRPALERAVSRLPPSMQQDYNPSWDNMSSLAYLAHGNADQSNSDRHANEQTSIFHSASNSASNVHRSGPETARANANGSDSQSLASNREVLPPISSPSNIGPTVNPRESNIVASSSQNTGRRLWSSGPWSHMGMSRSTTTGPPRNSARAGFPYFSSKPGSGHVIDLIAPPPASKIIGPARIWVQMKQECSGDFPSQGPGAVTRKSVTRSFLENERNAFFDTRVQGNPSAWKVLRSVCELIRKAHGTDKEAQAMKTASSMVHNAGLTCPTGMIWDQHRDLMDRERDRYERIQRRRQTQSNGSRHIQQDGDPSDYNRFSNGYSTQAEASSHDRTAARSSIDNNHSPIAFGESAQQPHSARTCRSGVSKQLPGLWDRKGNHYFVPLWCVGDPADLIENEGENVSRDETNIDLKEENSGDKSDVEKAPFSEHRLEFERKVNGDDDLTGTNNDQVDHHQCIIAPESEDKHALDSSKKNTSSLQKHQTLSRENTIDLRARLAIQGEDVILQVGRSSRVDLILGVIRKKIEADPNTKLRMLYLGKVLRGDCSLPSQGWQEGDVVHVLASVFN